MEDVEARRANLLEKIRKARQAKGQRSFRAERLPMMDEQAIVFKKNFPEEWKLFGGQLPAFVNGWDLLYKHCQAAYRNANGYESETRKRAKSKLIDCPLELMRRIFMVSKENAFFYHDEWEMEAFENFLDDGLDMNETHWAFPYVAVFIKAQQPSKRRSDLIEETYKRVASGELKLFSPGDVDAFSSILQRKAHPDEDEEEIYSAMVEDIAIQYRCNSILPVSPLFRAIFNAAGLWTVPSMRIYAEEFMRVFSYDSVDQIDNLIDEHMLVLSASHYLNLSVQKSKTSVENRLVDLLGTLERMKRDPPLRFVESRCIQCSAPAAIVLESDFSQAFCGNACLQMK